MFLACTSFSGACMFLFMRNFLHISDDYSIKIIIFTYRKKQKNENMNKQLSLDNEQIIIISDEDKTRINLPKDVVIGNHVWLGNSVVIMKGVHIEDGSVIGIESIVTKDIPCNCIAVGSPAKVIKTNIHWEK